jgi:Domain of unknown function DUF302
VRETITCTIRGGLHAASNRIRLRQKFDAPFGEVERKVREKLSKEGFGILSEINIQDKFKEKLGKDFREYVILGACNPPLAWEAFAREINSRWKHDMLGYGSCCGLWTNKLSVAG